VSQGAVGGTNVPQVDLANLDVGSVGSRYGGIGGGPGSEIQYGSMAPAPTVAAPTVSPDYVPPANYAGKTAGAFTGEYGDAPNLLQQAQQGLLDTQQGATGLFDRAKNFFLPEAPSTADLIAKGEAAVRALGPNASEYAKKLAFETASKAPSAIRQYLPLAAAGLGIMGLAGGFKTPESQRPGLIPTQTGFDLAKMYPERYAVNVPDAVTTYSTTDPYANMYGTPIVRRSAPAAYNPQGANIRRFADGGSTDYPTDMDEYIPMDGPIDGPGTGTSDSIPAMLSDGEFVFTAKAVRNMGNGSRREGAKRMYALMKQLEEAKNGN
jgi:hypothetical protein